MSPLFGDVILDHKGADDSFAHGMGRNKAIAYAPVKDVIERGVLIAYDIDHKKRNYDSAIVAAPITISGERFVCEVVITRKLDNRFYQHEVTPIKKLQNAVSLTNLGQSPTAHLGVSAKILMFPILKVSKIMVIFTHSILTLTFMQRIEKMVMALKY